MVNTIFSSCSNSVSVEAVGSTPLSFEMSNYNSPQLTSTGTSTSISSWSNLTDAGRVFVKSGYSSSTVFILLLVKRKRLGAWTPSINPFGIETVYILIHSNWIDVQTHSQRSSCDPLALLQKVVLVCWLPQRSGKSSAVEDQLTGVCLQEVSEGFQKGCTYLWGMRWILPIVSF